MKSGKTDAVDAEAHMRSGLSRPNMRFVPIKTAEGHCPDGAEDPRPLSPPADAGNQRRYAAILPNSVLSQPKDWPRWER